jgi:hypothetical protein
VLHHDADATPDKATSSTRIWERVSVSALAAAAMEPGRSTGLHTRGRFNMGWATHQMPCSQTIPFERLATPWKKYVENGLSRIRNIVTNPKNPQALRMPGHC